MGILIAKQCLQPNLNEISTARAPTSAPKAHHIKPSQSIQNLPLSHPKTPISIDGQTTPPRDPKTLPWYLRAKFLGLLSRPSSRRPLKCRLFFGGSGVSRVDPLNASVSENSPCEEALKHASAWLIKLELVWWEEMGGMSSGGAESLTDLVLGLLRVE